MKRREFITLMGGAAAGWPLAASAQQPAIPVVGYLDASSPGVSAPRVAVFRRRPRRDRYIEGQNVTVEYRWLGPIRSPAVANGGLVRRRSRNRRGRPTLLRRG